MPTGSIVKSLRVLGDINRLRMLLLLAREELSVAELQEILSMGQSTISTHLAQLKHAGMVEDRRAGKNIWYRSKSGEVLSKMLVLLQQEDLPEARHDQAALELVLRKRQDKTRAFFDDMAGRLGREYRKGDLEAVPIADGSVDLALFSQSLHHAQHPERAVAEAWRILKPGGRIAILDLVQHRFAEARELYADVWLGFSEVELQLLLSKAGFGNPHTAVVHKETEAPFFQTVLATGTKAI